MYQIRMVLLNLGMKSIRQTSVKTSTRRRECWDCGKAILKGEKYTNQQIRYDKTIISQFFHIDCDSVSGIN